ncbi:MAG: hypothetical protein C0467_13205 [Planctomycetaceae bacterium]|nr:hypothetical protein [Planctomycetaceae bacterium]
MKCNLRLFALATCVLLLLTTPALASGVREAALFGGYTDDFIAYWREKVKQQNSVVIAVLIVGAIALLIITRSKGPK